MNLNDVQHVCNSIFGTRGGDGSQEATGAVGHINKYPINGNGRKTLFLSRQGGPVNGPFWTVKQLSPLRLKFKLRDVDDCRNGVITHLKKTEWTGYHAEMIIVSRWIRMLYPALQPEALTKENAHHIIQKFKSLNTLIIAANAPCCKHCHHMLTKLGIAHPVPRELKHSLTAWWNPLTNERFENGSPEFAKNTPGLD